MKKKKPEKQIRYNLRSDSVAAVDIHHAFVRGILAGFESWYSIDC